MKSKPFLSFVNPPTPESLAVNLAADTLRAHRLSRKGREHEPMTDEDTSRMTTIAALLQGRHRAAILPLVLKQYPLADDALDGPPEIVPPTESPNGEAA